MKDRNKGGIFGFGIFDGEILTGFRQKSAKKYTKAEAAQFLANKGAIKYYGGGKFHLTNEGCRVWVKAAVTVLKIHKLPVSALETEEVKAEAAVIAATYFIEPSAKGSIDEAIGSIYEQVQVAAEFFWNANRQCSALLDMQGV